MDIAAQTLVLTIVIMATMAVIGKAIQVVRHYFSMKNEIKNYIRFEKQVGVLLDALDKKLPQSKGIELKNYMKEKVAQRFPH